MKKLITESYRLYWSKKYADYMHPETGLSRTELIRAAKAKYHKFTITYVDPKRNICRLDVHVTVGG